MTSSGKRPIRQVIDLTSERGGMPGQRADGADLAIRPRRRGRSHVGRAVVGSSASASGSDRFGVVLAGSAAVLAIAVVTAAVTAGVPVPIAVGIGMGLCFAAVTALCCRIVKG